MFYTWKANPLMSHNKVEILARELLSAYETGQMMSIPPSARPGFDLNTAYRVEGTLKQFREAGGHRAVGRKVGYANKAMWRCSNWKPWFGPTCTTTPCITATITPPR